VYDLFGYSNQTYQGADVLATHGSEQYLVFVPDFIGPEKAAKLEWFKPGADPKPLQDLLKIVTSDSMMKDIRSTASAIKSDDRYKHVQIWAGVGFCWGSKGVSLIAAQGEKSLFDVTAHSSPSRLDPEEAKTATVPTMMLTSNMEDEAVANAYFENLKGPKYFERFDEIHGWMSARYAPSLTPSLVREFLVIRYFGCLQGVLY
jgi:dienelactone hydrolase